jgi:hypothetical protein
MIFIAKCEWIVFKRFSFRIIFLQFEQLFWKNEVREWSEILHKDKWSKPSSKGTFIWKNMFSPIMSKNLSGVPLESLMKYDFQQYCRTFAYQNDSPYNGKEQVFVITLRINSASFVKLMRLFFSSCWWLYLM